MEKKHQKHISLTRPNLGNFGRNEIALVGTHCDVIKDLSDDLIAFFEKKYQIAYLDAAHNKSDIPKKLVAGAAIDFSDNIDYQSFNLKNTFTNFEFRRFFNDMDLLLVNGNHHVAVEQIVFIDETKKTSLQKRLSQLTNVQLFIFKEKNDEIFDFLKENIPNWEKIPVLQLTDKEAIVTFFTKKIGEKKPPLFGLVLAGGKSLRMGTDKGAITWHNGQEQRYYMADLLQKLGIETFISCRDIAQKNGLNADYQYITDSFIDLGPYGAILSAFRHNPNVSWLVVACDLPLLDLETLNELIENRDVSSIATTFESPFDGLPEPLITIWESKSYATLLSFFGQGYSCPRKVLRNTKVKILQAKNPEKLVNVNTQEEKDDLSKSRI